MSARKRHAKVFRETARRIKRDPSQIQVESLFNACSQAGVNILKLNEENIRTQLQRDDREKMSRFGFSIVKTDDDWIDALEPLRWMNADVGKRINSRILISYIFNALIIIFYEHCFHVVECFYFNI